MSTLKQQLRKIETDVECNTAKMIKKVDCEIAALKKGTDHNLE